jgi:3-deoxy-7-phosphoheptulonate synthase
VIIVTRKGITDEQIDHIRERVESYGLRTHLSRGEHRTVIGCIGDEALLREEDLLSMPGVESVTPVLTPYKLAAREFAARETVVVKNGESGTVAVNVESIRRLAERTMVSHSEVRSGELR